MGVLSRIVNQILYALLTRKDIIAFASERNLSGVRVLEDGECTVV